jgi:hypothetical protein
MKKQRTINRARFLLVMISLLAGQLLSAQRITIAEDDFSSNTVSGGSGWSGNWNLSAGGSITGGELFMDVVEDGPGITAERAVDLSAYPSALISFTGNRFVNGQLSRIRDIVVSLSTDNGTSFQVIFDLNRIELLSSYPSLINIGPILIPGGNANTILRLEVAGNNDEDDDDYLWDNIRITSTDTDRDGVLDHVDVDDDNDGIWDLTEADLILPNNEIFVEWTSNVPFGERIATNLNTDLILEAEELTEGDGCNWRVSNLDDTRGAVENATEGTESAAIANNDYVEYTFTTTYDEFLRAEFSQITFFAPDQTGFAGILLPQSDYFYSVRISDDNFATSTTLVSNAVADNDVTANFSYFLFPTTTYKVRIYFWDNNSDGVYAIDDVAFRFNRIRLRDDQDGDGLFNGFDLDADNDGIPDNVEFQPTNAYIAPNYVFNADGTHTAYNGIPVPVDTDGGGLPDFLDSNSDNDGISDLNESFSTPPSGSVGSNGLFDVAETVDDYTDVNGNAYNGTSFTLLDSDIDTAADGSNADPSRTDFDYRDNIDDSDGDGDGLQNLVDADDDNDGIIDIVEANDRSVPVQALFGFTANLSNREAPQDINTTYIDNVPDITRGSGITVGSGNGTEFIINNATTESEAAAIAANDYVEFSFTTVADDDDFLELELSRIVFRADDQTSGFPFFALLPQSDYFVAAYISDDNFVNSTDLGSAVADNQAQITTIPFRIKPDKTYTIRIYFWDTNSDGAFRFDDVFLEFDRVVEPKDSDGDGLSDHLDLDADNDGIPDNIEAQTTASYVKPSGTTDANGVDTAYSGGLSPVDTDSDGTPDILDFDSDNDNISDRNESYVQFPEGGVGNNGLYAVLDTNDNYIDPTGTAFDDTTDLFTLRDTDNDVAASGSGAVALDSDFDYRDSRNDRDLDGDGILDVTDIDDDNDGILDTVENELGFVLNGDAGLSVAFPGAIFLTANVANEQGTVMFDYKVDFARDFIFNVEVRLGTDDAGADGIGLVFHNDPAGINAVGGLGSALGVGGIQNGIAFVLDTYQNSGDPADDHTQFIATQTTTELTSPVLQPNLEDGVFRTVSIVWEASSQTLRAFVAGTLSAELVNFDVVNTILDGESTAYFGAGASTGSNVNVQYVRILDTPDIDTDRDGIANIYDLDSDNDGIPDNIEAQTTQNYTKPNSAFDATGLDTAYPGGLTLVDTDGDGTNDYLDADSDDDGVLDRLENYNPSLDISDFGANGLARAVQPGDDYTDVNGLAYDDAGNLFLMADEDADTNPNGDNAAPLGTDLDFRDNFFNLDTDGDLVFDDVDLDDDNDGILDVDEIVLDFGSLNYQFFDFRPDADTFRNIPVTGEDFSGTVSDFNAENLSLNLTGTNQEYSVRYLGKINITTAGSYTFYTNSDDGSALFINGQLLVDNDGIQGATEESGTISLAEGLQDIEILYFQGDGPQFFDVLYEGPGITKQSIPFSVLGLPRTGSDKDTDNDGVVDRLDLDGDNDGIPDNIEAQLTASYVKPSGTVDANGVDNAYAGGLTNLVDTDEDGILDYLDDDSDQDGILDIDESYTTVPGGAVGENGLYNSIHAADDYTDVTGVAYTDGTDVFTLLDTDGDTSADGTNADPTFADFDYRDNVNGLLLDIKVYLAGALINNGGETGSNDEPLMRDNLRSSTFEGGINYLPSTEPYTALAGFTHVGNGGGEEATATAFDDRGQDSVVDWVFVELRDATDNTVVLETRSALLQRDGDVVDIDGVSPLNFVTSSADTDYYVVVRHRNHLGVMTATAENLRANASVDFSDDNAARSGVFNYGTSHPTAGSGFDFTGLSQQSEYQFIPLPGNVKAMWAGNADGDSRIKFTSPGDRDEILTNVLLAPANSTSFLFNFSSAFGYFQGDIDLNGQVKFTSPNDDRQFLTNQLLLYPLNPSFLFNYNFFLEQIPNN